MIEPAPNALGPLDGVLADATLLGVVLTGAAGLVGAGAALLGHALAPRLEALAADGPAALLGHADPVPGAPPASLSAGLGAVLTAGAIFAQGPDPWAGLPLVLFAALLVAAAVVDLARHVLPNFLTFPLLWLGLALSALEASPLTPQEAILGAGALWFAASAARRVSWAATGRDGIGGGDVRLLAAVGAWLGPGAGGVAFIAAFLALAAVRAAAGAGGRLPFGPFVALAAWAVALARPALAPAFAAAWP